MIIPEQLETVLKAKFPNWNPLSQDGLFFLRANYTLPVVYKYAIYQIDPADRDVIRYKVATVTEEEVRLAKAFGTVIDLLISRLEAAPPVTDGTQATSPDVATSQSGHHPSPDETGA